MNERGDREALTEAWREPPERWVVPFTPEQVEILNAVQAWGKVHPYTCMGYQGCRREPRELVASAEGWVCPCGAYRQTWARAVPEVIADRALARGAAADGGVDADHA